YDGIASSMSYDGFLPKGTVVSGGISGSLLRTYNNNLHLSAENINGVAIAYGYDNDGLLNLAGAEQLTLDPVSGFLMRSQLGSLIEDYSYNSFGEMMSCSSGVLSTTYVRDDLGRIVSKTESVLSEPSSVYEYQYDNAGR